MSLSDGGSVSDFWLAEDQELRRFKTKQYERQIQLVTETEHPETPCASECGLECADDFDLMAISCYVIELAFSF